MTRWEIILACFNGPRVYRKFREGAVPLIQDQPNGAYRPNFLEENCNFAMGTIETCWTIILYASPLLAISAATRRTIFGLSPEFAVKLALGAAILYGSVYLGRGLGRALNKDYLLFLKILTAANQRADNLLVLNNNMRNLRKYDFDFRYWPIDYEWRDVDNFGEKIRPRRHLPDYETSPDEGILHKIFMNGLSWVVAHTIARRLTYPGTLSFLQAAIRPAVDQGRAKLVEQMTGIRYKLRTKTGNDIDSMFVDRRNNSKFTNGNTLVITCEGNGGFYEVGSASTPLEANYSVLMWNHPGFGGSTGVPWPHEEAAAVDVAVQFALHQLGWNEGDIVLYGWSIGGYTTTWVGMNYKNIRAMILDATFDDIIPLALHTMPKSWAPLVIRMMRTYFNLHIEKQLAYYNGPVTLIRRLKDEVMAIAEGTFDPTTMRKKNRANGLLKGLVSDRYPNIFTTDVHAAVEEWMAATIDERTEIFSRYAIDESECRHRLRNYIAATGDGAVFPLMIGADFDTDTRRNMALYLAWHYLLEFDATHNIPLSADKFTVPTHPWE